MKYLYLLALSLSLCLSPSYGQSLSEDLLAPAIVESGSEKLTVEERIIVDSVVDVVDEFGVPALSPEATLELVTLAQGLHDARTISSTTPLVFCVFLLGLIPVCMGKRRVALTVSLLGFGLLYLVPLPLFQQMGLIGVGFSLVSILVITYRRPTHNA
jgi:hypothetical protein